VKQVKPSFDLPEHAKEYTDVSKILNECSLYDIVNVTGIIFGISNLEYCERDGKKIPFRNASFTDKTGTLPLTIFGDSYKVEEKDCYNVTQLRVSKYLSKRILKTTQSTIIEHAIDAIEVPEEDLVDASKSLATGVIISVDMKSFALKTSCSICRKEIDDVPDDECIICEHCQNMVMAEDLIKSSIASFTLLSNEEKINLQIQSDLLTKVFGINVQHKLKLARSMMKTKVKVLYEKDKNTIITIEKVTIE